jgi:hypothetical protein
MHWRVWHDYSMLGHACLCKFTGGSWVSMELHVCMYICMYIARPVKENLVLMLYYGGVMAL